MTPPPEDDDFESVGKYRPGLLTIIISLLILVALLTTLILPILRAGRYRQPLPTPTPRILLEAQLIEIRLLKDLNDPKQI